MIEKLEKISRDAPDHLSAQVLLAYAQGTGPKALSIAGSVTNHNRLVDQINHANTAARTEREALMMNPEVIEELLE